MTLIRYVFEGCIVIYAVEVTIFESLVDMENLNPLEFCFGLASNFIVDKASNQFIPGNFIVI